MWSRGRTSTRTILSGRLQPVGIAVDGNLVATGLADGTVDVRTVAARPVAALHVGTVRATALSGGKLVVLRSTRLDVYDLASKSRVDSIRIPRATIGAVDVQNGIAVVASGRNAVAVDLASGV
jgi:hypothetical protein